MALRWQGSVRPISETNLPRFSGSAFLPFRIDILHRIEGIDFDEAWKDRVQALVENEIPAPVISREHLIRNKLAVGRLQDLADVEKIREAALVERSASDTTGTP